MNFVYEPFMALVKQVREVIDVCVWVVRNRHLVKGVVCSYMLRYLRDSVNEPHARIVRGAGKEYTVTYTLNNNRTFRIPLERRDRRPRNQVVRVTGDGEDITDLFFEWYGPYYDFHLRDVTPDMMGYEHVTVDTLDGNTYTFDTQKIISL